MRRPGSPTAARPWFALAPVMLALLGLAQLHLAMSPTGGADRDLALVALLFTLSASVPIVVLRGVDRVGWTLWALAMTLAAVGIVTATRLDVAEGADGGLAVRQAVMLALGAAAFCVTASLPSLEWLRRYKYTWLLATLLLMAVTLFAGEEVNGARLWLAIGPLRFQPSELAKVTLVAFLAAYSADRGAVLSSGWRVGGVRLPPVPYLVPVGLALVAALLLLLVQNDLGSALLLFSTVVVVLWLATGDGFAALVGIAAFVVAVGTSALMVARVGIRVQNWLDPWVWPQSAGFQQVQADYALGSGGALGSGLGRGQPNLVPFVRTDYVLAAIGEEWGLVATVAVALLFLLLLVTGMRVSIKAGDRFSQVLAAGLTVAVALQALIIAGGVVRLIPLTGLPLPFVSYGGSSLLINLAVVGLLARISRAGAPLWRGARRHAPGAG